MRVLSVVLAVLMSLTISGQQAKPAPTFTPREMASIATAMMDGDLCRRVVTARAIYALTHKDAADPWADADNYDVDAVAFLQLKKTMLRVQSIAGKKTSLNLWMQIPGQPEMSHVVIRLPPALSVFYNGEMKQPTPPRLLTVFKTGLSLEFEEKTGAHVVLAPVKDSLGHTAAVVEVVTQLGTPDEANQHKDY